ncbi:formate dehydrogenase (NAD+) [Rhodotorula sphaerocarpa]
MKVLCILYDGGKHAQQEKRLLGTTENALGLPDYCKKNNIELVVTSDKEGPNSEFAKHIVDAEVLITTPFHPGYLSREMIEKAQKLKIAITAGVGSDHIDLNAANEKKITVAEVTGSNVVSVAEHVVMTILILVRNFVPAHEQIARGDWEVAAVAKGAFDLEGKVVGTLGAGRIGFRVLQRLKPFDCKELLYYDYAPLPEHAAKEVGARRVEDLKEFLGQCDVVTLNCPLHEGTRGIINKASRCQETLGYMKKGAWLVNTARGALCVDQDVADAVNSGQLSGYGGDVWPKQPAFKEHPWRTMKNPNNEGGNAMVAHYSGTTLDAQIRYANGALDILQRYRDGKPQEQVNLIVENGEYASPSYGQRKK